ncbi:MAG TPA: hypothetical protein VN260_07380, partial [Dissulfurispiraceae bacterium]|nr:hypothetical protein [Dissulfurispiraceae bacterium]
MRLSRSSAAILITTVFVIIATILEIYFIQLPTLSIVTRLILVALLSINFLALLILVFLVAKN